LIHFYKRLIKLNPNHFERKTDENRETLELNVKKHNCVEITRTVIVSDTIDE